MVNAKIRDTNDQVVVAEPINQQAYNVYTYEQEKEIDPRDYTNMNNANNVNTTGPEPPVVTGVYANGGPTSKNGKHPYVEINSRHPVMISFCPSCNTQKCTTTTKTKASDATCVASLVGLVVCWPLFIVPFCVKGMKQTNHYCPNCGTKVGRVKAFH